MTPRERVLAVWPDPFESQLGIWMSDFPVLNSQFLGYSWEEAATHKSVVEYWKGRE